PSPAYMEAVEYSTGRWIIIRYPEGYSASTNWPVTLAYAGDSGDGNPTVVTGQSLSGSGTGPYTGNFTNGGRQVAWGTVVVKDNDVEVARGRMNGTIVGDGVSGTMNHKSNNGSISVTF